MDRRTGTSLARLGLTGEDAATTLRGLGWWATDGPAPGCEEIMWALARSPDQSLALHGCHSPMRQVQVLRDVLLDVLDELDDVQNVYDNSELSDAEMARLAEG